MLDQRIRALEARAIQTQDRGDLDALEDALVRAGMLPRPVRQGTKNAWGEFACDVEVWSLYKQPKRAAHHEWVTSRSFPGGKREVYVPRFNASFRMTLGTIAVFGEMVLRGHKARKGRQFIRFKASPRAGERWGIKVAGGPLSRVLVVHLGACRVYKIGGTCGYCKGNGEVARMNRWGLEEPLIQLACPRCGGDGKRHAKPVNPAEYKRRREAARGRKERAANQREKSRRAQNSGMAATRERP